MLDFHINTIIRLFIFTEDALKRCQIMKKI